MGLAGTFGMSWLERLAARGRRGAVVRAPIVASRDLPSLDMATPVLPRSPEPLPEETLVFARGTALRAVESGDEPITEAEAPPAPSIAAGADLRALLDRVQQASRRREALDQAAQARARIVEQLSAGRTGAKPVLALVEGQQLPVARTALSENESASDLDKAFQDALACALGTLRQLSELAKR
jgi:hypothetical protein